ncbi:sensor histidine kinase [Massilia sp. NR 4-1]|uniref:sensor histidine kinase n=1 Tax=Massilia sp. NR 4-1 TaxID=1678028 RepID=UPI0009E3A5D5|nr:sensor histidine kinase [Massilia sp. NR 4-1]
MTPASSCLDVLLAASQAEIYLLDPASLRIVQASAAACRNSRYEAAALRQLTLPVLAPQLERAAFEAALARRQPLAARLRRADGSEYAAQLCLQAVRHEGQALILAMAEDQCAGCSADDALRQVQSRFDAIVTHTPGLVYQFVLAADGSVAFPYLSDGCQALLGLPAAALHAAPQRFLELILEEDRDSYRDAMLTSASSLWSWNWEGRIWVDAWKDVKWINLRSTPRLLPGGGVQWEGIMTNITESKLEQLEVRQSRARLAELTAHIEKVKEQERTRIAREIHDDLGGNLTAIKMALAMLAARLPEAPGPLHEKAAYVDSLVDRTIDAVHRITLDLRPSILDFGLVAALDWQARDFTTQAGIACSFHSNVKELELDPDQAAALFRIGQEALTNIAKHANASQVSVKLTRTRHQISLKISDDGDGIRQADRSKPQSFGLRGMAERANALGGTLTLSHAPGGGTVVAIKIKREMDNAAPPAGGSGATIATVAVPKYQAS